MSYNMDLLPVSPSSPKIKAQAPKRDLKVKDRVVWLREHPNTNEHGLVKWLNTIDGELIAGIEFDRPLGLGSGWYQNKQLFTCAKHCGGLVSVAGLILEKDFDQVVQVEENRNEIGSNYKLLSSSPSVTPSPSTGISLPKIITYSHSPSPSPIPNKSNNNENYQTPPTSFTRVQENLIPSPSTTSTTDTTTTPISPTYFKPDFGGFGGSGTGYFSPPNKMTVLPTPTLPHIEPPLREIDTEKINGKRKGIQGNRNSCYLDATLFSMFSFTNVFDSFLISNFESTIKRESQMVREQDMTLAFKVQKILREEIVNNLRKELICPASNVMKLREAMQHLDDKMTSEEMDPQEFLHLLFNKVFHLEEFLSLSSGESDFFHQLLIHYNEEDKNKVPSVQRLLEQSLMLQDLKFKEIPSPALILQMPRSGNQYKTFEGIIPNLTIDITDLIENTPRQCIVCGKLATWECSKCYNLFSTESYSEYDGRNGCGAESTGFCQECLQKTHQKRERNAHTSVFKEIKYNFPTNLYFPQDLTSSTSSRTRTNSSENGQQHFTAVSNLNGDYNIPRVKMDLFAVICIETSHFVSFVKCGSERNSPWVFFDSMSDRVENFNGTGHNIPQVKVLENMGVWLDQLEKSPKAKDSRFIIEGLSSPELKRLLSDPYICLYTSRKLKS